MTHLRAGVIGVGYLGRFHAQKYAALPDVELVGVVDADQARAEEVAHEVGTMACTDYSELLGRVDLVSIVVPTYLHFKVAKAALNAGVHILLEKPVTQTVAEADELIRIAEDKNLVFQVGHLERFNPAVVALGDVLKNPMFIESHRLSPFKPRGTDVNVVLDLMIHDIDIILNMVNSPVESINSVGIANARLQFANGCVANVTASRVSREPMRRIRIFQPDAYVSIDYQSCKIGIFRKGGEGIPVPAIPNVTMDETSFSQGDPLFDEIKAFVRSVNEGLPPVVSGEDGKRALEVALWITRKLFHEVKS
jgi:predicted dehydrogenase